MELDWFFELYLRQPELPELEVSIAGSECALSWKTPGGMAFPMPVEVLVGGELQRVAMEGGKGVLTIPRGALPEFDPNARVLMKRPK